MIGNQLKRLAKENNMRFDQGIAYGNLGGYAATLCEGPGCRRIIFTTVFADPAGKTALLEAVNARDLRREFTVAQFNAGQRSILIDFTDKKKDLPHVHSFLQWFLPLLYQYGASPIQVCTQCGAGVDAGRWVMIEGIAYYFHHHCADSVKMQLQEANQQRLKADKGSYVTGAIGALLGALVGAILWGIVLGMGYVASLVGLVIGWLAGKGYDLLKGKQGKGKVVILIFAVILGVVLGTFLPVVAECFTLLEEYGLSVGDIPFMMYLVWTDSPEFRSAIFSDIGMGLLFAALGVFGLLRQTGKAVSGAKYLELK